MKKLILMTLVLASVGTVHAATTYTERVIQQKTQPIVNKEVQMRQEIQTRQEASAARQDARVQEAQRINQERIDKINATQQKVDTKKKQWNDLMTP